MNLDLKSFPEFSSNTGREGFSKHSLLAAFIVMKCEGFSQITDLLDYLHNNLLIAHYCGFDITKTLPSYWTFQRFLKNTNHSLLFNVMQSQVLYLFNKGIIDTSFIALDSTPLLANTSHNNPKSFKKNKFKKDNPPFSDKDCRLGVHSASNQHNEKNYEFYWGYKNHILIDCITGLPIFELTTPAIVADSFVALDILSRTNEFISLKECADKGYNTKEIYNKVSSLYQGDCFIPLNKRSSKNNKTIVKGNPICDAGLAMNKDGKTYMKNRLKQKYSCPFKYSKDNYACPCNHHKFQNSKGKKSRGCTKYVELPHPYGELRLDVDCSSITFKSVYSLRIEAERYNSRFKLTGGERFVVHNQNSIENLNTIAHISLLAVAIATINTNNKTSYHCLKSVKRIA